MSTATLLKANPSVFPKWKRNFHGYFCCISSAKFSPSYKFTSVKVASTLNSAPIPTSKDNSSVPFNFEGISATSNPREENTNFGKNLLNFSILKTLKWLKTSILGLAMALLPALFMMKINGHYAALALTGGSMGGHSFSSGRSSPLYRDHSSDDRESSWYWCSSPSDFRSSSLPKWYDDPPSDRHTRRSSGHCQENPTLKEEPKSAHLKIEIVGDQATVEATKSSPSNGELTCTCLVIVFEVLFYLQQKRFRDTEQVL